MSKAKETQEVLNRLREALNYDNVSGVFTWRIPRKKCTVGAPAGRLRKSGYMAICVDGVRHQAHRVAWAFFYGAWPGSILDHADAVKDNNRIGNLRLADKSLNAHNTGKWSTNTSGYKCVFWDNQRLKWRVTVQIRGKANYVGLFATKEEAHAAYVNFAIANNGEFWRAA